MPQRPISSVFGLFAMASMALIVVACGGGGSGGGGASGPLPSAGPTSAVATTSPMMLGSSASTLTVGHFYACMGSLTQATMEQPAISALATYDLSAVNPIAPVPFAAPQGSCGGVVTGLTDQTPTLFDASGNEYFAQSNDTTAVGRISNGSQTIAGYFPGLPIAIDVTRSLIYTEVASCLSNCTQAASAYSITVFQLSGFGAASATATALRTIAGSATGLTYCQSIPTIIPPQAGAYRRPSSTVATLGTGGYSAGAILPDGSLAVLAPNAAATPNGNSNSNCFIGEVDVFGPTASGNIAPSRVINNINLQSLEPMQADAAGDIYVGNTVFAPGANGNAVPVTLSGPPGYTGPFVLAANGSFYALQNVASPQIAVFSASPDGVMTLEKALTLSTYQPASEPAGYLPYAAFAGVFGP